MDFTDLRNFVSRRMRMSHIYQPVMLMTLLQKHGRASVREIAMRILGHDESQIEYYENIVKNMVGRVLREHSIVRKDGQDFELLDYPSLTDDQIAELAGLLGYKLREFQERRGIAIWQHRTAAGEYISGTLKYEVLKRAKFRCVLCGIPASERALEVDHIKPRNRGGGNDITNLQALCYACNAMKRDRDATDFRGVNVSYEYREGNCIFCELSKERVVAENQLCMAIHDAYPVTDGHSLIIPKRHTADYFDLGQAELNAAHLLLDEMKTRVREADPTVQGFNVGVNCGEVAGQTVFHCHVHLIPRRKADVEHPRGGVRNLISPKVSYPPGEAA